MPALESPRPASEEESYAKNQSGIPRKGEASLLGLPWEKERDAIGLKFPSESAEPTKRGILGKIARIYNPLGLASPVTLGGKLLYWDACDAKLAWDKQLQLYLAN